MIEDSGCALCGLPLGRSDLRLANDALAAAFCCAGCLHVYRILSNSPGATPADFRESELYRNCVAAGIIPGPKDNPAEVEDPSFPPAVEAADEAVAEAGPGLELTLRVEGMWCAACGWLIEEMLKRGRGILSAQVHFLTDVVRVTYLPHRIDPGEIVARIARLGYRAGPEQEPTDRGLRLESLRLGIAVILAVNIMMISLGLYGGFLRPLESEGIVFLSLALFLLATPVVFFSGWPLLRRAWLSLRTGRFTMESLIATGVLTAYGYSVARLGRAGLHLYFDTAAMLVALVLLGRFLESRARAGVVRDIGDLRDLVGNKVRLLLNGKERWLAADGLEEGQIFVARASERVAADGVVMAGSVDVDESILTGESRPVRKEAEDEVLAGSLLLDGELHLRAVRVGAASSLGRAIELVHRGLAEKMPVEQWADRITQWFVPLIFAIAGATGAVLLLRGYTVETALLRAITVLVIACPCALGIATPLAKVAVVALGRARGIVIRDAAAFEQARRLTTLVFDKTGTVTEGGFMLQRLYASGLEEHELLRRVAAVEAGEEHFLARAVRRLLLERGLAPLAVAARRSFPGLGVTALVEGEETAVGSRQFMATRPLEMDPEIETRALAAEKEGLTVIFAAWRGRVRGCLAFGDPVRPEMAAIMERLRQQNIRLWLLSGDSAAATAAVAWQLRIPRFRGQAGPEDKVDFIRALREKGERVGMVGDGINDAAALAAADLGVAVGGAPGRLMAGAANVTLLGDSPARLLEALDLSNLLMRTIRQNLGLAFVYNIIGIPLAVLGLLNPLVAVCAMFASSLTVIANTLRIMKRSNHARSPE